MTDRAFDLITKLLYDYICNELLLKMYERLYTMNFIKILVLFFSLLYIDVFFASDRAIKQVSASLNTEEVDEVEKAKRKAAKKIKKEKEKRSLQLILDIRQQKGYIADIEEEIGNLNLKFGPRTIDRDNLLKTHKDLCLSPKDLCLSPDDTRIKKRFEELNFKLKNTPKRITDLDRKKIDHTELMNEMIARYTNESENPNFLKGIDTKYTNEKTKFTEK